MKQSAISLACILLVTVPAQAALKVGANAPDFMVQAALDGREFKFNLKSALKKGPVVVYFFPAAFTTGCTVEAHDFAQAMPQYRSFGTSVIGVSHDDIATLKKFSLSACQSKFPVGSDHDRKVMKSYDAALGFLTSYADRVSYVISPDGKIAFTYSDLDPDQHVLRTLAALKTLAPNRSATTP
ncbi:MAG: peroxiredoxin [Alphaproteobacteria bacterium 64-11]|nr:peroxiredoxin [Alphaproteobacteria bacterium]OJU13098.1 MAG: peroxiredoxin [Alphaproteobacteria bacterium 64-11]